MILCNILLYWSIKFPPSIWGGKKLQINFFFFYKKGRERVEREEMEQRHLLDYNLSLFSTLEGFLINGIIVIFLFFIGLNDALLTNLWCFYSQNSVPTPNSQIVPQRSNSSMNDYAIFFLYIYMVYTCWRLLILVLYHPSIQLKH